MIGPVGPWLDYQIFILSILDWQAMNDAAKSSIKNTKEYA